MILLDVTTGTNSITCSGENGFIKRKSGEKIKIPSGAEIMKQMNENAKVANSSNPDKIKKSENKNVILMEGDIIVSGPDTSIILSSNHDKGKDKPLDDWKQKESKQISLSPNSELKISGIEKWDRKDEKAKKRFHGELIRNIELLKGSFNCSYTRTQDELITPNAIISFSESGGGYFDIYQGAVYCWPSGEKGVTFKNRFTKKEYSLKVTVQTEIIITKEAIFRKPFTKMDEFPLMKSMTASTNAITDYMPSPEMMQNQIKNMKNLGNVANQGFAGLESLKNMSSEDMERLMKKSEKETGQKISPEQLKQARELPKMIKMMENQGMLGEMKKGMAMMKGYVEGLGDKGIESLMNVQSEATKASSKKIKTFKEELKKAEAKPKNYGPLNSEFKVA